MIYARTCGVVGSLGAPVTVNAGGYTADISGSDLVPLSDNGRCGFDFTATIHATSNYTGSVGSETRHYATLDSTERVAADLVRGTAAGQKRWRKEVLIPAFGLMGAGIAGAIFQSQVPVLQNVTIAPIPRGVQLSTSFGF